MPRRPCAKDMASARAKGIPLLGPSATWSMMNAHQDNKENAQADQLEIDYRRQGLLPNRHWQEVPVVVRVHSVSCLSPSLASTRVPFPPFIGSGMGSRSGRPRLSALGLENDRYRLRRMSRHVHRRKARGQARQTRVSRGLGWRPEQNSNKCILTLQEQVRVFS